jgi:hypothetical protein
VKEALVYIPKDSKDNQGATYYKADNPAYGATFTTHLKKAPKTLKEMRKQIEDTLFKYGKPIPQPSIEQLRKEAAETEPYLTYVISDGNDNIIRRINSKPQEGISRVNWDLKYSSLGFVEVDNFKPGTVPSGILAAPGNYFVSLSLTYRDTVKELVTKVPFMVKPLNNTSLPATDRKAVEEFYKKIAEMGRIFDGVYNTVNSEKKIVASVMEALQRSSKDIQAEMLTAEKIDKTLDDILFVFHGKKMGASDEETPPAIVPLMDRYYKIMYGSMISTGDPTKEQLKAYEILIEKLDVVYKQVKEITEKDLPLLFKALDAKGVPATPMRLPEWKK